MARVTPEGHEDAVGLAATGNHVKISVRGTAVPIPRPATAQRHDVGGGFCHVFRPGETHPPLEDWPLGI